MKKAILGSVLGIALLFPASLFASTSPEHGSALTMIFFFVTGNFDRLSQGRTSLPKGLTANQAEIYTLNNKSENVGLWTQSAGGALNTAEIIK